MYLEAQTYIRINAAQDVPYSRLKSRACGTYFVKVLDYFVTIAYCFMYFVNWCDLDDTLGFVEIFIHESWIEITVGCYGKVKGIFSPLWHWKF